MILFFRRDKNVYISEKNLSLRPESEKKDEEK